MELGYWKAERFELLTEIECKCLFGICGVLGNGVKITNV
jgi:hypothetical protein